MNSDIMVCFKLLELEENASFEQVKEQYRFLVQCYHPDKHHGSKNQDLANKKMQEINIAYKKLEQYFSNHNNTNNQKTYSNNSSTNQGQNEEAYQKSDNHSSSTSRDEEASPKVYRINDFIVENVLDTDNARTQIKNIISKWSNGIDHHDLKDLGSMVEILSIIEKPAYAISLRTQKETREVKKKTGPTSGRTTSSASININNVNKWAFESPKISDFTEIETQDTLDGSVEVNECDSCNGHGELICNKCKGERKIECPSCNGGHRKGCSSCDGSGRVRTSNNYHTCSKCNGSGIVTCSNCCGSGVVKCSRCDGTGKVKCKVCEGNGRLRHWLELTIYLCINEDVAIVFHESVPQSMYNTNQDKMYKIDSQDNNESSYENIFNKNTGVNRKNSDVIFNSTYSSFPTSYVDKIPIKKVREHTIKISDKAISDAKLGGKYHFQEILIHKIPLLEISFVLKGKSYLMWVYGNQFIYAPDSPIAEVENGYYYRGLQLNKSGKYTAASKFVDKVLSMSPRRKEAQDLKKNIRRKILIQYIVAALLGGVGCLSYTLINNHDHIIWPSIITLLASGISGSLLYLIFKEMIGEMLPRAVIAIVVSVSLSFFATTYYSNIAMAVNSTAKTNPVVQTGPLTNETARQITSTINGQLKMPNEVSASQQTPVKESDTNGKQPLIEKSQFSVSEQGVITDSKTGLEWILVGPDNFISYEKAVNLVSKCHVAGGGWHMPTRAELRMLYLSGVRKNHMAPFNTTSWLIWAEPDKSESWSAWSFDFGEGVDRHSTRSTYGQQPFAVRSLQQNSSESVNTHETDSTSTSKEDQSTPTDIKQEVNKYDKPSSAEEDQSTPTDIKQEVNKYDKPSLLNNGIVVELPSSQETKKIVDLGVSLYNSLKK